MKAQNAIGTDFDLGVAQARIAQGEHVGFPDVTLTRAVVFGRPVWFATDYQYDPIQRNHRNGTFYEMPELQMLKKFVPMGATFVDIGANIGNHSLFAALFLNAAKVIPFEPQPRCIRLITLDAMLNGVDHLYDFSHLGKGLADRVAGGFGLEDRERNLGATKLLEGEGDLEVTTGDIALADVTPDFIKIDVEGMEMLVLSGLKETVARARPLMMIEVDQENYAAFHAWVAEVGYAVIVEHQRYQTNKNFIIGPEDT